MALPIEDILHYSLQNLVAYLLSYHERAMEAFLRACLGVPAICLPFYDAKIPPSAFSNGTTDKPVGLFSIQSP